jgi:hypothetical protein
MTTKYLELSRHEKQDYERVVSLMVDKSGVYEETYTYKSLSDYDDLTLEELIYDATVNHDYVLERSSNGAVILKNSKKFKNEVVLYPKTNEFEIMEYNKMVKK